MGQYKFKQDFEAIGTNVVPYDSKIANFKLRYSFKKDDVFNGEVIVGKVNPKNSSAGVPPDILVIYAPNAFRPDNSTYSGKSQFNIPFNVVEQVGDKTSLIISSSTNILTPTNIFIGLLLLAVGFGLLKWQKII